MGHYFYILNLLVVILVTLEVLSVISRITDLISLFVWYSRAYLIGYLSVPVVYHLLISAIVDHFLVRGGVVISDSISDPKISETPEVVDLGLTEILGL